MPLPAGLLARLKKRGLVKVDDNTPDEGEEVFAEDYDDDERPKPIPEEEPIEKEQETEFDENRELVHEVSACPNIMNMYHSCTKFCEERWGKKEFSPSEAMIRRRDRTLTAHPLPEKWREVADTDTNRYYYWNVHTDEVSWLPPTHPRAKVTFPAEKLKNLLEGKENVDNEPEEDEQPVMPSIDDSDFEALENQIRRKAREKEQEQKREKQKKERRGEKRKKADEDTLDPMDPASYSDIARGSWSTGLERGGDAKTGVDSTASGPLFQQRPYPSPGAILRANRKLEEQE
ncbi:unnamed protein product [Owenia fusiformis]|uniref:Polyglutamine-binding protein 1 n=1 Tax=Owenia fusiformis TaxID=6347 RepID=A0A8J1UAL8_OWEFU|nr:unnamed protein product [Owenia fusiformis]